MEKTNSIRTQMEEFLVYKRSLGYVYETQFYYLKRYIDYVISVDPECCFPEKTTTDKYINELSDVPGTLYGTVACLREFSRYLQKKGISEAYIIPPKVAKQPVAEPPYFFTQKECDDFFRALDQIEKHPSFKGRELVLPALFRLLYCCGLRCKEARTLKCENVHLKELYLDIIQSKGPKSRRIFISLELAEYLHKYDDCIKVLFPDRTFFFPNGSVCYGENAICGNFKRFWTKAYPDFVFKDRPRAYDFRHHFAYANLNKWASEGIDINVMSAYLMRYMGHQTIAETLYYFHFVPEFFPKYKEMTQTLEDILPEVSDEE